ncbi:MAG: leucyl aminopeptidase family protein [Acidobacteria bacterium]|nr:leucyl aminopeptidase family protein [Acidobacteriota bacterium]
MVAIGIATRGRLAADHVAVACFEDEATPPEHLPAKLAEAVSAIATRPGWRGRDGQTGELQIPSPSPDRDQVVSLWGLGRRDRLERSRLCDWLDGVASRARTNGARRVAVVLPDHPEVRDAATARHLSRDLLLSEYRFDRFRQGSDVAQPKLGKVLLLPPPGGDALYRSQLPRSRATATAVARARDLANAPPNEATPRWLAERAAELAAGHGFRHSRLDVPDLEARRMGGILAVGRGSRQPPCLLRLERGDRGPIVALVGKGVTFDSGGLSIKSARGMVSMKYDKAGACTVLAAALAAAELDLPIRLRVYLPLAENMVGGDSFRPGDVIRCFNGRTVEIVNTDAEGRLLLADAMAWAVDEGAEHLVELSTLTGGVVAALGYFGAALFTPDETLAAGLLAAAEEAGEKLWRMPLWPEFSATVRGNHADLKNSAGRPASAATAAAFLASFVGGLKSWAHLDIAGTAQVAGNGPASGFGTALLVDWLHRLAEDGEPAC